MKKSFLLYVAAVLLIASMVGTSCRKHIIHSNAPTPNNVRMQAYTKITTIKNTTPIGATPATINENYRFYYDAGNRVSQIVYTSNDSTTFHMISDFKYYGGGDTVIKTTTNAVDKSFIERDTFILKNGFVTKAYTPFLLNEYEYYGKLLTRHTITATSYRYITMKTQSTYTSVNGDFLRNYYDGALTVTFNTLKPDLTVFWLKDGVGTTTFQYKSMDFSKTNYNFHPVYIHVKDTNNVKDSLSFAGYPWYNESYHFYTEDANRIGDYLQLQSFTKYGVNVYRNSHLVESITNTSHNAYIKYAIDAESKITQTQVVETDSLLNTRTMVYDIQYETY